MRAATAAARPPARLSAGCGRRGLATSALPTHSRVVVVGGGIIGTSTAYHLAKSGCEVTLLERDQLTSGTTWHAAGLMVTYGSLSETSTELRKYTKELYGSILPAETGLCDRTLPLACPPPPRPLPPPRSWPG